MRFIWFRQDCRIRDNTALYHACQQAEGLTAVYVFTPKTWARHDRSAVQVDFLLRQLAVLSDELAALNIPLKCLTVPTFKEVPAVLSDFMAKHNATELYFNDQVLLDERQRDKQVVAACDKIGVKTHVFDDLCLTTPGSVVKQDDTAFKVYSPFKRQLMKQFDAPTVLPKIRKQAENKLKPDVIPKQIEGFESTVDPALWPVGEDHALKHLKAFCEKHVHDYKDARNFPAQPGTSQISPYLAIGIVSPRQCVQAVLDHADVETIQDLAKLKGEDCWISEVLWREFYLHIAHHFPEVVKHQPFQPWTDGVPWSQDKKLYKAWCEGKTGFPFVDAAMRCLNETGWMHNRLRMVVAMFLTKTLFLDWRMGEEYFMRHLVDGEFAANNGGWQWSASTGTDAAPYFRIFNPTTQSEKFDPDGDFIRQWLPELAELDGKSIHNPLPMERAACGYPEPVVDYSHMRTVVTEAFKAAKL